MPEDTPLDASELAPKHKDEFDRIYDLEDPGPYYRALSPADYRMPGVLGSLIKAIHPLLSKARGKADGVVRVLDFGCGYGANGALLRHRASMADLYAYYAGRAWQPGDGRANWARDRRYFEARRFGDDGYFIGGVDIAGNALAYALELGFIDRAFHEDLVSDVPSAACSRFLSSVDLIIECGGVGPILHQVFQRVLDACGPAHRPWFIFCPRPDVDWRTLNELWNARGYRTEHCRKTPVKYRKPLGEYERRNMLELARALGRSDDEIMRDDYLLVNMTLARHHRDALNPLIQAIQAAHD